MANRRINQNLSKAVTQASLSEASAPRPSAAICGAYRRAILFASLVVLSGCGEQSSDDLPHQADRWVSSIALQSDSKARHVGKTSPVLGATKVHPLSGLASVTVGEEVDGVQIGAIKCQFDYKDASYSGEQFMWRGRWACLAGRSRYEVENAVQEDGTKLFDYIHISPVSLGGN